MKKTILYAREYANQHFSDTGDRMLAIIKSEEKEFTAMQARIEKLENKINKAIEWLNHYPSQDGIEEQTENNRKHALRILINALKDEAE